VKRSTRSRSSRSTHLRNSSLIGARSPNCRPTWARSTPATKQTRRVSCSAANGYKLFDRRIFFRQGPADHRGVKRRNQNRHDLERLFRAPGQRGALLRYVFQQDHLKLERVLAAVQIFVGEEIGGAFFLQPLNEIAIGLRQAERRLEIFERENVR